MAGTSATAAVSAAAVPSLDGSRDYRVLLRGSVHGTPATYQLDVHAAGGADGSITAVGHTAAVDVGASVLYVRGRDLAQVITGRGIPPSLDSTWIALPTGGQNGVLNMLMSPARLSACVGLLHGSTSSAGRLEWSGASAIAPPQGCGLQADRPPAATAVWTSPGLDVFSPSWQQLTVTYAPVAAAPASPSPVISLRPVVTDNPGAIPPPA